MSYEYQPKGFFSLSFQIFCSKFIVAHSEKLLLVLQYHMSLKMTYLLHLQPFTNNVYVFLLCSYSNEQMLIVCRCYFSHMLCVYMYSSHRVRFYKTVTLQDS